MFSAIPVAAELTYPLRRQVLGRGPTPAELDCALTDWGHYGVIIDGGVAAVGVTHPRALPVPAGRPVPGSWRIIGMAVDQGFRRRGLGTVVLTALLAHVRSHSGRRVWCQARVGAAEFYRRHGFDQVAAQRDDRIAGPQLLMSLLL
ncbi:GNAT family N-acetyltransferase [Microlunatus parietis]|uniref:Ribosomal protein S18 acetylase RimI-like enzyme n=1 Tax=Microlunatus parietis TaxID=682979 RepID=A0A7Y9IBI9_9ACTN|nr:GNAT family N-acetyltransferase [Microlunatus parietis]NYE73551.1 ribosomal protein S18 acetylase RimI-like enzyme [Microlunatus parietis]